MVETDDDGIDVGGLRGHEDAIFPPHKHGCGIARVVQTAAVQTLAAPSSIIDKGARSRARWTPLPHIVDRSVITRLPEGRLASGGGRAGRSMYEDLARNRGCVTRSLLGLGFGGAFGGLLGGARVLLRPEPVTKVALSASFASGLRTMGRSSALFGLVGLAFTGTDCAVEAIRGVPGPFNAAAGGAAAGVVTGLMTGSLRRGVAAVGLFSLLASVVEFAGGRLSQQDDTNLAKLLTTRPRAEAEG